MYQQFQTNILKENIQEIYNITNKCCPFCGEKFPSALIPIVNINNVGYHLNCYLDISKK